MNSYYSNGIIDSAYLELTTISAGGCGGSSSKVGMGQSTVTGKCIRTRDEIESILLLRDQLADFYSIIAERQLLVVGAFADKDTTTSATPCNTAAATSCDVPAARDGSLSSFYSLSRLPQLSSQLLAVVLLPSNERAQQKQQEQQQEQKKKYQQQQQPHDVACDTQSSSLPDLTCPLAVALTSACCLMAYHRELCNDTEAQKGQANRPDFLSLLDAGRGSDGAALWA